jgi:hypothetical protein
VSSPLVGKVLGPLVVGGVAAGVTWVGIGPLSATPPAAPRAWIDEPLAGALLPPGEAVDVVTHATDGDGVALVTLIVDGEEVETVTAGGGSLVTVEVEWMPPGEGTYLLEAVGEDTKGKQGEPGQASITIGSPPEPGDAATSTTTSTTTDEAMTTSTTIEGEGSTTTAPPGGPGVTPTTRPGATTTTTRPPTPTTAPPCQRPAPVLTSPGDGRTGTAGDLTLAWAYSGCSVRSFRVEVSLTPDFPPTRVTVGIVAGDAGQWQVQPALLCGRTYHWRVRWVDQVEGPWSSVRTFTTGRLC